MGWYGMVWDGMVWVLFPNTIQYITGESQGTDYLSRFPQEKQVISNDMKNFVELEKQLKELKPGVETREQFLEKWFR
jgi:hypothetical protein